MGESTKAYTFSQFCEKARKYCAYQERCHKELRTKLFELGADSELVEQVITKMIEENFLHEERFAKAFAGGKFRQKQWGKNKIVQELKMRQISPYCIKIALMEIPDDDYLATLRKEVEKRMGQKKNINNRYVLHKIAKQLVSKGFESDMVWKMLLSED
ncbi:MAG TPA: regulatory protein RecX [Bacteroidia bacterium]|nr:regulatory protein RecX [Bacteroidia bacterium]